MYGIAIAILSAVFDFNLGVLAGTGLFVDELPLLLNPTLGNEFHYKDYWSLSAHCNPIAIITTLIITLLWCYSLS
jgi:hypothetical protein